MHNNVCLQSVFTQLLIVDNMTIWNSLMDDVYGELVLDVS